MHVYISIDICNSSQNLREKTSDYEPFRFITAEMNNAYLSIQHPEKKLVMFS